MLEGDQARIDALIERMLNAPAGSDVDYKALGSRVLLQMGGFEHVSSMVPPFDRWGDVREIVAAFWVPVLAGRDLGDVFLGERFGLALPYIFVDNPMSYLGGRETYGYAKTMGRFDPADGVGERQRMDDLRRQLRPQRGRRLARVPGDRGSTEHRNRRRKGPARGP